MMTRREFTNAVLLFGQRTSEADQNRIAIGLPTAADAARDEARAAERKRQAAADAAERERYRKREYNESLERHRMTGG